MPGYAKPVFLLGLAIASCSHAYAQTQPQCSVQVGNSWGSGSQVAVVINNPGNTPITDWHVELTYSDSAISNSWSSTREGNNPYVFSAPGWSPTIQPNNQYQFGYTVNHISGFEEPEITACFAGDAPVADEDSDGVDDATDQCPGTMDTTVDNNGCGWSQLDDDNDSVLNPTDSCPNTPAGEAANSEGCADSQLDSDNDGILNGSDTCPDTPAGESADSNGCSDSQRDDDSDGVANGIDQCPDTQTDNQLDAVGCSWEQRDDDGDGSINQWDACPDTAPGAPVNTGGCALEQLDEDKDGVNSAIDICPFTPEGEAADAQGCSISQRDTDGDGVNDLLDQCPGSQPPFNDLDSSGCTFEQRDDDNDGVLNEVDACPETPLGEAVDLGGCSDSELDFDADGVPNGVDQCPDTQGEAVDANGCGFSQRDDDNDGVLNLEDHCPTTPIGEPVNAQGCPLDDDNDGIINRDDQCPETPVGELVHPDGCAESQLDFDGDGVANGADQCPESMHPFNEIDSNGCTLEQRDDDNDGIANQLDACPETPAGETVDLGGCGESQLDFDGDNVSNLLDKCPERGGDTSYGCPSGDDEDQDKVFNLIDSCPFEAGLRELNGCAPAFNDFDNDGVNDQSDLCPHSLPVNAVLAPHHPEVTPEELVVNAQGCNLLDLHHDFDGDGIMNGEDLCPESFGSTLANSGHLMGCSEEQARDNDRDGIINGLDMCPEQFGIKALNGCVAHDFAGDFNDLDGDFVFNSDDHCPHSPQISPGLFEMVGPNGCLRNDTQFGFFHFNEEDLDQDGIADKNDNCPATPAGHVVDTEGCTGLQLHNLQDTDNDGVRNQWDLCPDTPPEAPISIFGCLPHDDFLDHDRDGLPEPMDLCPSEPGLLIHNGCSTDLTPSPAAGGQFGAVLEDRDFDGFPDFDDHCPYTRFIHPTEPPVISFTEELHGCTSDDLQDSDSDGVLNGHDRCPFTTEASFMDNEGCSDRDRLDSDNDNLINGEDLCPNQPGYWRTNGCGDQFDDADGDGIPDEFDQCPLSPVDAFGGRAPVSPEGCIDDRNFLDDDKDGVFNLEDQCPNTEFGELVTLPGNSSPSEGPGCSFLQLGSNQDEDGDGVPEFHDACPETPAGSIVDMRGCFEAQDDIDGDNVPNDIDQCHDSLPASPLNFEGCDATGLPEVNEPVRFTQIPAPSPENPVIAPQEHELNFFDLAVVPKDSPLDPFQPKELEIDPVFLQDPAQQGMDFFFGGPDVVMIHIDPAMHHKTFRIPVRIEFTSDNVSTNWFEIIISPRGSAGGADIDTLIVNDPQLLFDTGIRLNEVFERLARDPFPEAGRELFRNFWRSQRSEQFAETPFFCTGETNGFPIVCDRFETEPAFFDDFETDREMDFYTLTAVVNRMDVRRGNWDDCGEHRLVFAAQGHPRGRKFFIFEARVANPIPGDIRGCENTIRFWEDMAQLQDFDKAQRIREFFIDGAGQPPVMSPEHFFAESGQIRTNQFMGGEWLLKEHKLVDTCGPLNCGIFAETVTVKENPFGELFNPDAPSFASPAIAQAAVEFQDHFLDSIDGLATEVFGDLKITTDDRFNHGQSHSSGIEAEENNFVLHFNNGGGVNSGFGGDIQFNLQGRNNADGSPLEAEQLLARATGLTCGGCHMPSSYGIDQPGAIGALAMPDGSFIDSWPQSLGFVHIDEQSNLSPALTDVFLPIRAAGFGNVLGELNTIP